MPVFISYSHSDATTVDKLAVVLVQNRANIWIDRWELNVGDSILGRVQDAIGEASALLVVLSKASVASEWCKKELSAGLMRELDEKRVLVLPVLIEDCEVPLFLREKMYADLRTDFDEGVHSILNAIAKVTNTNQGRLEQEGGWTDWAHDWGLDNRFYLRFTMIESRKDFPATLLTQIHVICNAVATSRYLQYEAVDLGWFGRATIAELLFEFGDKNELHLLLEDQFPKQLEGKLSDTKSDAQYELLIESRCLGQDSGKDLLVNISNYLRDVRKFMKSTSRKLTKEETLKALEIARSPFEMGR